MIKAPSHFRPPLGSVFWICWPVVARFGRFKARIPIRGRVRFPFWYGQASTNHNMGFHVFDIRTFRGTSFSMFAISRCWTDMHGMWQTVKRKFEIEELHEDCSRIVQKWLRDCLKDCLKIA